MLYKLVNLIHILFIFSPVIIFFTDKKYLSSSFKFIFLIFILVPIHWVFFNNQCLLTLISKKMGDFRNTRTNSQFSEVYMKWLYKPIIDLLGWEWNSKDLNKIVNLHWSINIILLWYYLFYIGKKDLV